MAFFKFRKGGDETPAPSSHAAPESVEAMRTRARHRLIGASVLVLLGVIGFPLLFDSQPRPISVDIPIDIPDKATVKPLVVASSGKSTPDVVVESDGGKPVATAPAASPASRPAALPSTAAPAVAPVVVAAPAALPSRASAGSISAAPVPAATKPTAKPVEKPVEKPAEKPAPRADDGAKAQALLEGKSVEAPASAPAGSRFVVQIGAYSDTAKAQEARMKLERAGLKTYTQVVQPKEGKRIRVRVGPYESKAEADKVAEKIRKLELPAAILEL